MLTGDSLTYCHSYQHHDKGKLHYLVNGHMCQRRFDEVRDVAHGDAEQNSKIYINQNHNNTDLQNNFQHIIIHL